jgi:NAD(P)-dependent dehydrogenase (short-subunit alcohol dehydrogenase family)
MGQHLFLLYTNIYASVFPTEIAGPISEKDLTEEGAFSDTYIPLGRGGKEYEMAGTILYLASKAGSYVNGDLLVVDGGRLGYL